MIPLAVFFCPISCSMVVIMKKEPPIWGLFSSAYKAVRLVEVGVGVHRHVDTIDDMTCTIKGVAAGSSARTGETFLNASVHDLNHGCQLGFLVVFHFFFFK